MKEPRISPDAAAIVKAIDRLSDNTGKWLAEIAEAVASQSDPDAIKSITARVKAMKERLKSKVDEGD